MKVGIIGGGPSGLYLAKYLSKYNHLVTIFEKEAGIGGMYRYSQLPPTKLDSFNEIIKSKNIKLIDNCEINKFNFPNIEKNFDAFVLATGGIPVRHNFKSKNILYATDVIMGQITLGKIGQNILIIGMGNVSMDLIRLLFGETNSKVKSIDVVSRSNLDEAKFTNNVLRDVIDLEDVKIDVVERNIKSNTIKSMFINLYNRISRYFFPKKSNNPLKDNLKKDETNNDINNTITNRIINRIKDRRRAILSNLPNNNSSRSLRLLFNTSIENIFDHGSSFRVKFKDGIKKTYDTVISSMGFVSNPMKLNTSKPVFMIGWCNKPRGNIGDALTQAKLLSLDINNFLKRKVTN